MGSNYFVWGNNNSPQQVRCQIQEEEPTSAWCLWETAHHFFCGSGTMDGCCTVASWGHVGTIGSGCTVTS